MNEITIKIESSIEAYLKIKELLANGELQKKLGLELDAVNKVGVIRSPIVVQKVGRSSGVHKTDLISKIADGTNISKVQAGKVLDSVLNTVVKSLKKGDKVTLIGFGTFAVAKRAARTGRNPQTGATIKIPAKKVVKFTAGKELIKSI